MSIRSFVLKDRWEPHYRNMRRWVYLPRFVQFVSGSIKQGSSVLDVACGGGEFLQALSRRLGPELSLHGVDIDPERLRSTLQHARSASHGDAHHLPFRDEAFDMTLSFQTLHVLDSPMSACREMERVTKRSGLIFVGFSDQKNALSRLYWRNVTKLQALDQDRLQQFFSDSTLVSHSIQKFINLYSYASCKLGFTPPLTSLFDLLSVISSRLLRDERHIAYHYLLFRKN